MRLQLTLALNSNTNLIPANYQYPLAAAIYKIIHRADENYSEFLHDRGYQLSNGKSFKLFTFSDLNGPLRIEGDRFRICGTTVLLLISSYVDEAAGNFLQGLFIDQRIEIADKISGAKFRIVKVRAVKNLLRFTEEEPEVIIRPLSPLVNGCKNDRGHYDFLSPAHPKFQQWLIHNWVEKYKTLHPGVAEDQLRNRIQVRLLTPEREIKSRLITIKAFTPAQTQIRGFTRFRLGVQAPVAMLDFGQHAGLGLHNAMGCGCVEIIKPAENQPVESPSGTIALKNLFQFISIPYGGSKVTLSKKWQ